MNAPLNQEEFKDTFLHQDSMYKLINNMAILGAVRSAHYPFTYDKLALCVAHCIDGSYQLVLYKDEFRSVKTFKTLVERWMYNS
jgi:hypothetical protein